MLFQSTVGIISLIFIQFFQNSEPFQTDFCPFVRDEPVPYETLSPTNINTKTAIPINETTALIIKNGLLGPLLIKNTGYAVEIYGHPAVPTTSGSYGGVLCNQFYKFHKLRIYFNQNPKGGSYGLFNGIPTPLTLSILYYNSNYSTFDEALNHRNGVANEIFHYTYTKNISNFLFIPLEPVIPLLREPGTAFYANEALLYAWFVRIPIIHEYYVTLGSYQDLETGKQYQCTTDIVAGGIFKAISISQFEKTFALLKNINGSKLQTVSPTRSLGKRKVYKATKLRGQYVAI